MCVSGLVFITYTVGGLNKTCVPVGYKDIMPVKQGPTLKPFGETRPFSPTIVSGCRLGLFRPFLFAMLNVHTWCTFILVLWEGQPKYRNLTSYRVCTNV